MLFPAVGWQKCQVLDGQGSCGGRDKNAFQGTMRIDCSRAQWSAAMSSRVQRAASCSPRTSRDTGTAPRCISTRYVLWFITPTGKPVKQNNVRKLFRSLQLRLCEPLQPDFTDGNSFIVFSYYVVALIVASMLARKVVDTLIRMYGVVKGGGRWSDVRLAISYCPVYSLAGQTDERVCKMWRGERMQSIRAKLLCLIWGL